MKKVLAFIPMFALLIILQTIPAFAKEDNAQIISADLSVRVPVSGLSQQAKVTDLGVTDEVSPRIDLPGILIYSVVGTPYATQISTGELYYFPEFKVGYEVPIEKLPSNQLVMSYNVAQTQYFEKILNDNGYELYGWHQTMEYGINTYLNPKMLEVSINGKQQPLVKLDSTDKQHMNYYEFEYIVEGWSGVPYEAIVDGNLVCAYLDGSAALIPYRAGLKFNQP